MPTANETITKFEHNHQIGAMRHPKAWFVANQKAVSATREILGRHDLTGPEKLLVSTIVLRILDAVLPSPKK